MKFDASIPLPEPTPEQLEGERKLMEEMRRWAKNVHAEFDRIAVKVLSKQEPLDNDSRLTS